MYEDLEDLDGDLLWVAMEASLRDTSMMILVGLSPHRISLCRLSEL